MNYSYQISSLVPPDTTNDNSPPEQSKASRFQQSYGLRVCNRCIQKKVKCDLQRPACSRCIEARCNCVYSHSKKKPGPSKISKRKRSETLATSIHNKTTQESSTQQAVGLSDVFNLAVSSSIQYPILNTSTPQSDDHPWSFTSETFNANSDTSQRNLVGTILEPNYEQELLENFFLHIHPSIPLFDENKFLQQYKLGLVNPDLLLTIILITVKVLGLYRFFNGNDLDNRINSILEKEIFDGQSFSLNTFQQACLLAFYAFHQYGNDKAWMRISLLTRKAYNCNLHQVDTLHQETMKDDEIEEWRYIWWCIYCLDSYSNITSGTPFVVEIASIKTALPTRSLTNSSQNLPESSSLIFLPDDTSLLWRTTQDINTINGDRNFHMHIITTMLLREAATARRLWSSNPSNRTKAKLSALGNHLSAVRLALPSRYLNAARNVLMGESSSEHHARLICVLHLHISRVMIDLPLEPEDNEAEWLDQWHQNLEHCHDIVSVVKHWDSQFFTSVDPAVCFIIFAALLLLHVHYVCDTECQLDVQERLGSYKNVLLLFLQQFASVWDLPRFLIKSFEKFSETVTEPLLPKDINRILKGLQGPLHPCWLSFLPTRPSTVTPSIWEQNLLVPIPSEWNFDGWDIMTAFPDLEQITASL